MMVHQLAPFDAVSDPCRLALHACSTRHRRQEVRVTFQTFQRRPVPIREVPKGEKDKTNYDGDHLVHSSSSWAQRWVCRVAGQVMFLILMAANYHKRVKVTGPEARHHGLLAGGRGREVSGSAGGLPGLRCPGACRLLPRSCRRVWRR